MNQPFRKLVLHLSVFAAAVALIAPVVTFAQTAKAVQSTPPAQSAKGDRWLHVRVESHQAKGETVRVNVPIELAEKVLPTINHDRLKGGKVKIDQSETQGVDLHAIFDAVRTAKDGEFVTVQGHEQDVRVAKQNGQFLIFVNQKGDKKNTAEIRVPMKVVEALFSAGKDELDLVAALHALSATGDTELVSVKDSENTVRVWLDSKNVSD
jgi:hypothetical protein